MRQQNHFDRVKRVDNEKESIRGKVSDVVKSAYQSEWARMARKQNKQNIVSKYLKKDDFPDKTKTKLTAVFISQYKASLINQMTIPSPQSQPILKQHQFIALQRAFIVNQILLCLTDSHQFDEVYFRTIWILDRYMAQRLNYVSDQKLIDMVSYFFSIACKCQGRGSQEMNGLLKRSGSNKLSRGLRIEKQLQILQALNFKVTLPTLDWWLNVVVVMVENQFKNTLSDKQKVQLITIAKVVVIDWSMALINAADLAVSILVFGIRYLGMFKQLSDGNILTYLCELYGLSQLDAQGLVLKLNNYDFWALSPLREVTKKCTNWRKYFT